jgi:hypothetical protein
MASTKPTSEECNCFIVRPAATQTTQQSHQLRAPRSLRAIQFSVFAMLKRKWIRQRAHHAVLRIAELGPGTPCPVRGLAPSGRKLT